jgi:hypothetical protein
MGFGIVTGTQPQPIAWTWSKPVGVWERVNIAVSLMLSLVQWFVKIVFVLLWYLFFTLFQGLYSPILFANTFLHSPIAAVNTTNSWSSFDFLQRFWSDFLCTRRRRSIPPCPCVNCTMLDERRLLWSGCVDDKRKPVLEYNEDFDGKNWFD